MTDFRFSGDIDALEGLIVRSIPNSDVSDYDGVIHYPNDNVINGKKYRMKLDFSDGASFPFVSEIFIPSNVEGIINNPYSEFPSLERITVDSDNPYLTAVNNVLFDKHITTLLACKYFTSQTCIPASVKKLGRHSLAEMNIAKLVIPSSIETLCTEFADFDCSVEEIFLPSSVKEIKDEAFINLFELKTIYICKSTHVSPNGFSVGQNLRVVWYHKIEENSLLSKFNHTCGSPHEQSSKYNYSSKHRSEEDKIESKSTFKEEWEKIEAEYLQCYTQKAYEDFFLKYHDKSHPRVNDAREQISIRNSFPIWKRIIGLVLFWSIATLLMIVSFSMDGTSSNLGGLILSLIHI